MTASIFKLETFQDLKMAEYHSRNMSVTVTYYVSLYVFPIHSIEKSTSGRKYK